jgi:hypothetical protein
MDANVWAVWNPEQDAALQELLQHPQSDRVLAVVGGAVIDDSLDKALRLRLRAAVAQETDIAEKLFKVGRPLGNLGPKIDLAYLLYMFEKPVRNALYGLSEIRNFFAHNLVATFDSDNPDLRGYFGKLSLHEGRTHFPNPITLSDSEFTIQQPKTKRELYLGNFQLCTLDLLADARRHRPYANTPT